MFFCCLAVIHHSHDLEEYLLKYDSIVNTLACIIRAFETCLFFKIFSAAVALMGVHLIQPYLQITYYEAKNDVDLIPAMKEIYKDLSTTPAEQLTNVNQPAFCFVDEDIFKKTLWHTEMLKSLEEFVSEHREDIVSVIQLMLKACAEGFELQRGNIFEFGNYDVESPNRISVNNIDKLSQAPINTIAAEQTVGASNYERKIHGSRQLAKASASIVKGKIGI